MPIYAFECDGCGHRFDRLQKLSDADPTDCPQCGVAQVRRQLTAPQFRLAGGGWYETDFKKDGDKKRNLADKGGAESGGTSSGSDAAKPEASKSESKTESKAESKPATTSAPAS